MAINEAPATAQAPAIPMHRDERHSVEFAAQRIAQGLIGAEGPTETPSEEPSAPSRARDESGRFAAAEEVSAETVETEQGDEPAAVETEEATSEAEPAPTDDHEAAPELPGTIAELAAAFEAEPERFNDLKVTAKIDGEPVEVTLSEALAGYQRTADYTQKTQALAHERSEFEQAVSQAEAELQSRVDHLATLTKTLESQIVGAEPDWDRLLKENPTNPTAYVKAKHEWDQKQAALRQSMAQISQQQQHMQAQQQQAFQKHLEAERQRMVTAYPQLADPDGEVASGMRSYLKNRGFSEQEIGQIADHRMIGVLMDAIKAQAVETASPEKKLVKPKSRTVRPGTPGRGEERMDRMAVATRNHRANPKSTEAAANRIALIMQKK